ncbi:MULTISPECIES: hypothetical protein [Sphingobium]|jgi:hypothetical protein|nr:MULTISPECIES: hypothetical protein [Sphingobium]PHP16618.1 hypothetical protein CG471_27115 [Sphingobium sp. IP1]
MMVVTITIWPGGDEAAAFDIAQMKIENESRLADVSDYTARIFQCENLRLGVQGIDTRVQISSHPRRDGPWTLLRRILNRLDLPS